MPVLDSCWKPNAVSSIKPQFILCDAQLLATSLPEKPAVKSREGPVTAAAPPPLGRLIEVNHRAAANDQPVATLDGLSSSCLRPRVVFRDILEGRRKWGDGKREREKKRETVGEGKKCRRKRSMWRGVERDQKGAQVVSGWEQEEEEENEDGGLKKRSEWSDRHAACRSSHIRLSVHFPPSDHQASRGDHAPSPSHTPAPTAVCPQLCQIYSEDSRGGQVWMRMLLSLIAAICCCWLFKSHLFHCITCSCYSMVQRTSPSSGGADLPPGRETLSDNLSINSLINGIFPKWRLL